MDCFPIVYKIALAITLPLVVVAMFLWYASVDQSTQITTGEALSKFHYTLSHHSSSFDRELFRTQEAVTILSTLLSQTIELSRLKEPDYFKTYRKRLDHILKRLVISGNYFDIYIYFHPSIDRGPQIAYYKNSKTGQYQRETDVFVPENTDRPDWLWYTEALKNKIYWSNPYRWENFDLDLISHTRGVYQKKQPLAVVGVDIPFNQMKTILKKQKLYNSGGFIIFNHTLKTVFRSPQTPELTKAIKHKLINNQKTIPFTLNGKQLIGGTHTLANGWFIVGIVDQKEVFQPVYQLKQKLTLISLIGIMIAFLIAFLLSRSISRPLSTFTRKLKELSDGDFKTRIDPAGGSEIREVTTMFNRMVENIEEQHQKINALKNYLVEILENISSRLITLDQEGKIISINSAARNDFNRKEAELTGKTLEEINSIYTRYIPRFSEVISSGKPLILPREHHIINDRDHFFHIFITGMESNRGILIKGEDITELVQKEQQISQIQKMEMVGTLAGGLAHDFNNVLGGIEGTVSLILYLLQQGKPITREDFTDKIEMIEYSVKRATEMIQRLLSLSRDASFHPEMINLSEILSRVIHIARNSFDKSIKIATKITGKNLYVMGDYIQIEQVLLNIAINAAHAMTLMLPAGAKQGGTLTFTLEEHHQLPEHPSNREYILIKISDTGIGIPKKLQNKIFEPFFTTKPQGKGTGLGLASAFNTIRQHRGTIKLYSHPGEGTSFNIFLPAREHSGDPLTPRKRILIPGEGSILIIDDEELMRLTAGAILEEAGYRVTVAGDGHNGIELFQKIEPDLVLLDLSMPGISGLETARELLKIAPKTSIIVTSGFIDPEKIESVQKSGISDFIHKPYNSEILTKKVASALKQV